MGLESIKAFEAVSSKALLPSERTSATLPLANASGTLQITFNTTNNIKEAPKHPVADIIDAAGKLMITVTMGVLLLTSRTFDLAGSVGHIQSALSAISTLGKR